MKDIQGVQRGKCNSCECIEYRAPEEKSKFRCEYCNHTPTDHVQIVELGACKKDDCDCDQYSSEDPNSYTECQYCGCPASQHEGAQARKSVFWGCAPLLPCLFLTLCFDMSMHSFR